MTWNKGNSHITRTINEINNMKNEHKPHIIIINEFNYTLQMDINQAKLNGYKLELDELHRGNKQSRTAMYIKDFLSYKRVKE